MSRKEDESPLFLGGPLLGGGLGRRRSGGLGDTAGLGLANNLGLLNDSGSLENG